MGEVQKNVYELAQERLKVIFNEWCVIEFMH